MATVNLITLTEPLSAASEAYRMLRTNLMFSNVEQPIRTLLVTSPAVDDQKSVALANIAVTLAQAGNKTILIDTDLRNSQQHSIWGIENKGLAEMMRDDTLLANPPLAASGVDYLSILPAGEKVLNPADVLSSKRLMDIIGILKARATYVLFDAPPVLTTTDATLLGIKVDGVLLIVRNGTTRRDEVKRAKDALERVHARVLGAMMTHARR